MIIKNGKLITWGEENQILENADLYINDGVIEEIGTDLGKKYPRIFVESFPNQAEKLPDHRFVKD